MLLRSEMKRESHIKHAFGRLSEVKDVRLHALLLSSFFITILLILSLDFLNIEAFGSFNQKLLFELTWKGRMFYLFFVWLLMLETVLDWEAIVERQRMFRNRLRALLAFVFAAVPSLYVLSVNFLGLDQLILDLGQALQISQGFMNEHWPLSFEYLILASFFILAVWLAYGAVGLKSFSISLSLLAGMGSIYLLDTIWPFGTFKPMQLVAVPTAAFAVALLDLIGYTVKLTYPFVSSPEYGALPRIEVWKGEEYAFADLGWPCAGVHSLLLFILITLVFFKRTTIQRERRISFFLIGAAGTYFTNVLRIASYFTISVHYGQDAGVIFHDSYGELYFVAWIFIYFMSVVAIQSGKISELARTLRKRSKALRINDSKRAGKG